MKPQKKTREKTAEIQLMKPENAWNKITQKERKKIGAYCTDYIRFLSTAKTEREAYHIAVREAEARGFVNIEDIPTAAGQLKPGMTVYRGFREKTLLLARIGKQPLPRGLHILGGHVDAPRLDAKPNPLYQDSDLLLLDTHYYGGIKKYQWVAMPLALHGVIAKKDGTKIPVSLGEAPDEPVLVITDLLPHLGKEQAEKKLADAITGEGLNVLVASLPVDKKHDDKNVKDKVKLNVLKWLKNTYDVQENDLASAELEIVPAGPARELGLDRSMILGYAHDDRACAYAAMRALFDARTDPEFTSIVLLCDKEEIGSVGATGMDSTFFENSIAELMVRQETPYADIDLRRCLERSRMLSADVNVLHDPNYPDVSSPNNMAKMNAGVVISKYTGARGKSGSSEANAEFVADIRRVFEKANVVWQMGELGKVDAGGGGTIALFLARYGMDVVDCGVGLLSMHAPWEVAGKLDLYMAYKAYKAFLDDPGTNG